MELQQILSKMESEGWEIADDFKAAQGHFLQYFLETVEEALRQPLVSGEVCDNCGEGKPLICAKCYETESNFRESY